MTATATATVADALPASAVRESVLLLPCADERLFAVLTEGGGVTPGRTAVIVVVGGPQYRAGSHRQFVRLARSLAAAGYPTLRFDARGMGDSTGTQQSFESLAPDVGAAIDGLLAARPALQQVVLWGLCDGAAAALLYLQQRSDPRVGGLCLLNPWVRSEASLARTQVKHYYGQRLLQRAFWLKLLRGQVALQAVNGLWSAWRAARRAPAKTNQAQLPYQARMAAAWHAFAGPVLLVLSGNDYTAREFVEFVQADPAWKGALARPQLLRHDADGADHTFSASDHALALEAQVTAWLHSAVAPAS